MGSKLSTALHQITLYIRKPYKGSPLYYIMVMSTTMRLLRKKQEGFHCSFFCTYLEFPNGFLSILFEIFTQVNFK